MSTLENLRKSARRWLKALRADDAGAHARLKRADPNAPSSPALRDVQHALAREHGHESWISLRKAALLLDHGADIDAVDDEYRSTPLGVAARWGRREVVRLLLDRGADPNRAGASWASPLAWAVKKGHFDIAATLRSAGAR